MIIHHVPVFADFINKEILKPTDTLIIDATLGEGGHTALFLERGLRVIGLDRDKEIQEKARARLASYADRLELHRVNFAEAEAIFESHSGEYDLVLFDLGISMFHYRESGRGFTFQGSESLDMRLDREGPLSAAEILATWSKEDLANLFYEQGGEKKSRQIASLIVERRKEKPLTTTDELVAIARRFYPPGSPIHPATRVFQALRIAVNDELSRIRDGIHRAVRHLKVGGRVAVITYHSLEDKIAKETFREFVGAKEHVNRYREEPKKKPFRLLFSKPVEPDAAEVSVNPSARSAKLRVLVKEDP